MLIGLAGYLGVTLFANSEPFATARDQPPTQAPTTIEPLSASEPASLAAHHAGEPQRPESPAVNSAATAPDRTPADDMPPPRAAPSVAAQAPVPQAASAASPDAVAPAPQIAPAPAAEPALRAAKLAESLQALDQAFPVPQHFEQIDIREYQRTYPEVFQGFYHNPHMFAPHAPLPHSCEVPAGDSTELKVP